MFLTAAFTGLRMGELLALRWGDVDFAGEAIRVRHSYNIHGGLEPGQRLRDVGDDRDRPHFAALRRADVGTTTTFGTRLGR